MAKVKRLDDGSFVLVNECLSAIDPAEVNSTLCELEKDMADLERRHAEMLDVKEQMQRLSGEASEPTPEPAPQPVEQPQPDVQPVPENLPQDVPSIQ